MSRITNFFVCNLNEKGHTWCFRLHYPKLELPREELSLLPPLLQGGSHYTCVKQHKTGGKKEIIITLLLGPGTSVF